MKHQQIKGLKEAEFQRLTGIKISTFYKMITILKEADNKKKAKGGRKNKLSIEDQLLMSLEYMREYRTYFHIAKSYGISESSAYKGIKWVENILIKDPIFALPGRKSLVKSDSRYEVILIDATETPIERPKKNNSTIILERKDVIQ
jgi:transposase